ncbi:F-box protein FBXO7, putative [Plasmodium vivax]|uniref:F-box domain-containing protein n=2 Tax=Plasmodium vivax TaxID=5855 RepID=A0A1G4GYI1_PLAVI|nr:hypothetical protein PVBG_01733 [Plasmodium vivax Brazil I]CAI7720886.1 F-box protein FBXO7, putative [Plasmodium vivax]SCO67650.1 conserved Plasmodium protein, unknown function [Plasmodium vivax]
MNELPSGIIKEVFKFLTYKDVLKNKNCVSREFHCAVKYNDLWKCFYGREYADDLMNRKKNDPFKELFYIRHEEKKKNKYVCFPKSAQEQFLDMEASLLALGDSSFGRFDISHLYNPPRFKVHTEMHAGDYGGASPAAPSYYTGGGGHQNCLCDGTPHDRGSDAALNGEDMPPPCEGAHRGGNMTNRMVNEERMVHKNQLANENHLTNENQLMNKIGEEPSWNDKITLRGVGFQEEDGKDHGGHVCSFQHCEFKYIPKSDVYICTESKNFHICDDKCELAISSDIEWGYLVCPLSGKMFDCLLQPQCRRSFNSVNSTIKYILTYDMGAGGAFQYVSPQEENDPDDSYAQEMEPSFAYGKGYSRKRRGENGAHGGMRKRGKRQSEKKQSEDKQSDDRQSENRQSENRQSGRIPSASKNSVFKKILDSYRGSTRGHKRGCKGGPMRNG